MARVLKKRVALQETAARARRLGWRWNPATVAQDVTEGVVEIIDGDTIFRLRKPIDLTVRRDGPYFLIVYQPLGIEEYGKSEKESLDTFAYHFGALWEGVPRPTTEN